MWRHIRISVWLPDSCLRKGSKTWITSHGALQYPNHWHSTKRSSSILHSWLPVIYTVKEIPPQVPKCAYSDTISPFQRSGVINYFHWLQRTYPFAALEIPTSKYRVCKENGKQLKRQMNAHVLRNVSRLYRTEYRCSATLLSLEIWSNTNANGTVRCPANSYCIAG